MKVETRVNPLANTSQQATNNNQRDIAKTVPTEPRSFDQKANLNRGILSAASTVSINTGNQSLSLVYKSALENINAQLEEEFGPNALQTAFEAELDVSPEATAQRIVDGSLGFFDSFRTNNPELSEAQAAEKFSGIISQGIENGFNEAREILDSLGVLNGDIATNIDETFQRVTASIDNFRNQFVTSTDVST